MNGSQRIEVSQDNLGQPILASGQPIPSLYESLISECKRRGAGDEVRLFAEPVEGGAPDILDWYATPGATAFVQWSALDPDQRGAARENLRGSVESLRNLKDGTDPNFDALIEGALQIPSEADLLISDGQPVLVRWGMAPEGQRPEISTIDAILAEAGPAPIVPPSSVLDDMPERTLRADAGVTLFLSMTLTLLVLAVSGLLMLQNCGLALPRFLSGGQSVLIANFCPVADTIYNPNSELLARLEREVRERVAGCAPAKEPPLETVQTETEDEAITTPEFEDAIKSGVVEKVLLRIYDNTQEDGDVVTVTAPGYRRTITLTNEGATFEIPLVRGEMKLFGEHDGWGGITVSVALTDGTHIVDGSMREGEQISLTIPQ